MLSACALFGASLGILVLEFLYRVTPPFQGTPVQLLGWVCGAVVVQVLLWVGFHHGTSLVHAWVVFSAVSTLLRLGNAWVLLGEKVTYVDVVAVALIWSTLFFMKYGEMR
jgi:hypothetical protein